MTSRTFICITTDGNSNKTERLDLPSDDGRPVIDQLNDLVEPEDSDDAEPEILFAVEVPSGYEGYVFLLD